MTISECFPMRVFNRVTIWWNGIPPSITEQEDCGSFLIRYQDPNHPLARVRFNAAARHVRFFKKAIGTILTPVATAAIIKWLGLS